MSAELLSYYLDTVVTDQARLRLFTIYERLDSVGSPWVDRVNLWLGRERDDQNETLDGIVSILHDAVKDGLRRFEVTLTEDADDLVGAELLYALDQILPHYEDRTSLMRVIECDYSEEETFATWMSYVTEYSVEYLMTQIDSVGESLIQRAKETLKEPIMQVVDDRKPIIARLKAYLAENPTAAIGGLIRGGDRVGCSIEYYLDAIPLEWETLEAKQLGMELVGLLMATPHPESDLYRRLVALLTYLDIDVNKQQVILTEYKGYWNAG